MPQNLLFFCGLVLVTFLAWRVSSQTTSTTTPKTTTTPVCNSRANPNGDLSTYVIVVDGITHIQNCPPGTLFNEVICACDHEDNVQERSPIRGGYGTICINIPRTTANQFCTGPAVSLSCWRERKREEEETEEEDTEEEGMKRHDCRRCGDAKPASEPGTSTRIMVNLPVLPRRAITININNVAANQFIGSTDLIRNTRTARDVWITFCKPRPIGLDNEEWEEILEDLTELLSEMNELF